MLSDPRPPLGESMPTDDWRQQASRAFGDDAIQPMVKQFLSLLQKIYTASCQESELRSMSVQFLSLEDDPFMDQLTELFSAFAAEQLRAPVCLMSFDTGNRIRVANYGMLTERHPIRGAPVTAISDERDVDLTARSRTDEQQPHSLGRTGAALVTLDRDPAERLGDSIERERSRAALLVVKARPIDRSIESLIASRKVDGVVMIVEAGETEAKIAVETRDKVTAVGGRMLGVVLKNSGPSEAISLTSAWHGLSIAQRLPSAANWLQLKRPSWLPVGAIVAGFALMFVCFAVVASIVEAPADRANRPGSQSGPSILRIIPKLDAPSLLSPRGNEVGR